jgi:hypothetical protein
VIVLYGYLQQDKIMVVLYSYLQQDKIVVVLYSYLQQDKIVVVLYSYLQRDKIVVVLHVYSYLQDKIVVVLYSYLRFIHPRKSHWQKTIKMLKFVIIMVYFSIMWLHSSITIVLVSHNNESETVSLIKMVVIVLLTYISIVLKGH